MQRRGAEIAAAGSDLASIELGGSNISTKAKLVSIILFGLLSQYCVIFFSNSTTIPSKNALS
jgi:hypothetical protein